MSLLGINYGELYQFLSEAPVTSIVTILLNIG